MKKNILHKLVIILLILFTLTITACVTMNTQVAREKDLLGMWINPDYDRYADINVLPDLFPGGWYWSDLTEIIGRKLIAVHQQYRSTDDDWITPQPNEYEIIEKWVDVSGFRYFTFDWNWWFKTANGKHDGFNCFILLRLSQDKQYFEFVLSREEIPSEIDPDNESYHIYYRI